MTQHEIVYRFRNDSHASVDGIIRLYKCGWNAVMVDRIMTSYLQVFNVISVQCYYIGN